MTDILIDARRGAGSSLEILYGTVTWKPTLTHSRGTSVVLPAPTTYDLVDGQVVATNVQPTPAPVGGQIEWAYEVTFKDRHGKTFSFLVGVPDSTSQVNFISLPRYFETKPPLFGQGPKGDPGESATVAVGTVTGGTTAQVNNSGTNTDAVLDFVLPEGPQGPPGAGVTYLGTTNAEVLPTVYPDGLSYFFISSNTGTGWPFSFASVWTYKPQSAARTSQRIISHSGEGTWQRIGTTGSVWGAFERLATTALATTTANGLMSSADKVRLDDFGSLPIRTKTATDAPSTYPSGTSVVIVDPLDGWPQVPVGNEAVVQVTTHKTKDRSGGTLQWVNSFNNAESDVLFRTALDNGTWGSFRKLAMFDGSLVKEGAEGIVHAAHYGAPGATVGDGINNDYWTIQRAINAGKEVVLEGGKTYLITGTLSMPANGRGSVKIRATGAKPAILKLGASGQSYPAIKFENNTVAAATQLTSSIAIGTTAWTVESSAGIEPGMLCEVISTKLWYFDPRDSARKSELHKVRKITGRLVEFYDPSNDGYDLSDETVTLNFFRPISVDLENLHIQGTHAPIAEENNAVIGVEITHADTPRVVNVSTEDCARTGLRFFTCYSPRVSGGYDKGVNNYWNGYGVSIDGCANAHVKDRNAYECRRPIDVTGQVVISRNTVLENCKAFGGGRNSRGDWYGWKPDGTAGTYQGGYGTHGGCDQLSIIDCHTIGIAAPIIARGRDINLINHRHIGNTTGGIIACSTGTNIFVSGGLFTSGYWGHKHTLTHQSGNYSTIISKRPEYLIRFYPAYQMNDGPTRGRAIIKGVTAELKGRAIYFDTVIPQGHFTVADNDFHFASDPGADDASLLFMFGTPPGSGKSNWFIGPNRMVRDNGPGGIKLAHNLSLTGANVLNYAVSS